MNLKDMKKTCKEMGMWIPENGKEAKVQMNLFRDLRGLENLKGLKGYYENLEDKYSLAREFALLYKEDISNFPEKLNENEKGNIGVINI